MKWFFSLILGLSYFIMVSQAQEVVVAHKEVLGRINVGRASSEVEYASSEEGFYSPGSPTVDDKGTLWFFPYGKDKILVFSKLIFSLVDYPDYYPRSTGPNSYVTVSQQGEFGYYSGYPSKELLGWVKSIGIINPTYNNYETPNGGIVEVQGWVGGQKHFIVSIEQKPNTRSMTELIKKTFVFRNPEETRAWLPTQPGGFSIDDDGLLYRNGMLWSAMKPLGQPDLDWRYIGRLMSGHVIWCAGPPEWATTFTIVDSKGEIELVVKIPTSFPNRFNWGLGPWGEFYYLHAPPMDKRLDPMYSVYSPEPGVPADLVVYRNHLKLFGRLNADRVRLRKEPNTTSAIVGTYPVKTGFRILETGTTQETIGGKTAPWIKVRLLDGKEGWFFGAFVANLYDGPDGSPPPWPNVPDW
ncbi:MAG: SH3 domain-containing protein [Spirochaetes bacterium]|nr:SH3 domain-containing protein [Spirochaetota bacterium]